MPTSLDIIQKIISINFWSGMQPMHFMFLTNLNDLDISHFKADSVAIKNTNVAMLFHISGFLLTSVKNLILSVYDLSCVCGSISLTIS